MKASARWALLCCFFAASFCMPQVSFGADDAAEAKRLRAQALAEFDKKHYQEAREALENALRLQRTPGALALLGSCLEGLEHYDEALTTYETFLREFPEAKANMRDEVQRQIVKPPSRVFRCLDSSSVGLALRRGRCFCWQATRQRKNQGPHGLA